MKTYFANLFKYHAWANRSVIDGIKSAGINDENTLKILSHLLLAEKTWLKRLKSEKYDNNFWVNMNREDCERLNEKNTEEIKNYINSLTEEDFEKEISYTNSKGIEYKNSVSETLTHLSHHSSYHRGQIAREMRRLGIEPVYTDYIAYIRQ